uniref:ESAG-like protein n=1 Tax=Leishmania donovani TaxID=5661 RepID=A1YZ39_LEIDO|nr:ESAG-like protein [Leishmania donovani]
MPSLVMLWRSSRQALIRSYGLIKAASSERRQWMQHQLVRFIGSERDLVHFKRFLLSTLLLALLLSVTSAAAVVWQYNTHHCNYIYFPIDAVQRAKLGTREPLPERHTGYHPGVNTDLERRVNAYLAQHNGTDGVTHLPIRIHFLVVSNQTDWSFCMVTASCALAGVRLRVLGIDSNYSHVWRYEHYLDYLDREGLRDEDIVVALDTDVAWTGSDVAPFLQKFARYSPASEAVLDLAAVRAWEDYGEEVASSFMESLRTTSKQQSRPLMQLPPVIFNADDDCYYHQPADGLFQCFTSDYITMHLIAAARNGASFFCPRDAARASKEDWAYYKKIYSTFFSHGLGHRLLNTSLEDANVLRTPGDPFFYDGALTLNRNPSHYLNAGMHISRVWALREVAASVLRFAKEQRPRVKREWACDQSILGILRYYSRMFEINAGLLFQTGHRPDGRLARDQFGLPVGLISVDHLTEFMFTSNLRRRRGLGQLTPYYRRHGNDVSFTIPDSDLIISASGAFVTPSLWRREVPQRCFNVTLLDGSVSSRCFGPPKLEVFPSFLHFAAGSKQRFYRQYRAFFSWYFAARRSLKALSAAMTVLDKLSLDLWCNDTVQHVPFFSVCPSPFHNP